MAPETESVPRCRRCATLLRQPRPTCPSCGATQTDLEPLAVQMTPPNPTPIVPCASPTGAPARPGGTPAGPAPARGLIGIVKAPPPPPKPKMKMCELCLTSLPEREVVEHEGRKICPECRGNLLRKSGKAT